MKKIVLVFASLFLLVGCMGNKASDAVKNYLNQYRNLSNNVATSLDDLTEKQNLSNTQKELYQKIMRKQYQDLKYEIVNEEYDGDNAKVTAKINVYDLYKFKKS